MAAVLLAFFVTNIDGFLCLEAAFVADPPRSRLRAAQTAALAFALLVAIAVVLSLTIHTVAPHAVRWLGLIPAGIGAAHLLQLRAGKPVADGIELSTPSSIFAIVLLTGTDNVAVYTPLYASLPARNDLAFALLYVLLFGAVSYAAAWTATRLHLHRAKPIVEPLLALFFIAIGVAIFGFG
ncbi:MAG: cadmium resistance transporter [Vulcanimicrobiaceae bacterium]